VWPDLFVELSVEPVRQDVDANYEFVIETVLIIVRIGCLIFVKGKRSIMFVLNKQRN
jgi:hypothetical protein